MAKPYFHAQSSAKKYGGIWEDYMEIHELIDSSKAAISDNRHRALTHNSWFIGTILPRIFGETFKRKSDGKIVNTRDIGEQHVLEDFKFKFIPTAQDYLQEMDFVAWMQNGEGEAPVSHKKIDTYNNNKVAPPVEVTKEELPTVTIPVKDMSTFEETIERIKNTIRPTPKMPDNMVYDGMKPRPPFGDDNISRTID